MRKRLRVFTEDRRVEGIIIVVVLFYFLFICLDFAVPEIVFSSHNSIFTDEYQAFIQGWTLMFWIVDLIFLSIFIIEITLRVYAWGMSYIKDVLNFIDAIVVFASFAMLFATMDITIYGGTGEANANGADSARASTVRLRPAKSVPLRPVKSVKLAAVTSTRRASIVGPFVTTW